MPKKLVVALSAPMLLIGAAYPANDKPDVDPAYAAPLSGPTTYRPCRPGRGDDNCIQLYERGVRTAYAQWRRERGEPGPRTRLAMGGPAEEAPPRRQRQRQVRRCIEDDSAAHRRDHRNHRDHAPPLAADDIPAAPTERDGYGRETRGM